MIEQALKLLSPRTLHSRFHSRGVTLSKKDLDYLTTTDGRDHVSWLVIDPSKGPEGCPIALGRYVRDKAQPSRAEVALTVCDEHQGQGVSKVLLGALSASALAAGVESFHGSLLTENHSLRQLMQSLGAELSMRDGLLEAEAPADPWRLPEGTAARKIRRVAAQVGAALSRQRDSASSVRMRS